MGETKTGRLVWGKTREEAEAERKANAKKTAIQCGHEWLTPAATAALFGISSAAVRMARKKIHRLDILKMDIGKEIHLIRLNAAFDYWAKGRDRSEFESALKPLRTNGEVMAIGPAPHLILHTKPLVMFGSDTNIGDEEV